VTTREHIVETRSYAEYVLSQLEAAGIGPVAFIFEMPPDQRRFGNALAVFGVGSMILRITRDRGQEFLDIAASTKPTRYFGFTDIEIAMGWTTIQEVRAKGEHPALSEPLDRLRAHFDGLNAAFSSEQESRTAEKIEQAQRESNEAILWRFRGGKPN
jgi:hypothetical protein